MSNSTEGFEGRNSTFDALAAPTLDERARQQFVSQLRKHIMVDLSGGMSAVYAGEVEPQFVKEKGRAPKDSIEVRHAMLPNTFFRAWSALRYTAQEMTWSSVRPMIQRDLPKLVAAARRSATSKRRRGSLRLNSSLDIPKDMQKMDIHLMPGGFHSELVADDVGAGAVYHHGSIVFAAGFKMRASGRGVAMSIASYLRAKHPHFKPQKILDLGTTVGGNLLPYLEVFPDAEAYGIDVGAPLLRYAHARAESLGLRVHYSQQDAQHTDFPDNTFDIVCSSFFLHEHSLAVTRNVFKEALRILKPGGVMVHMELPPDEQTTPYYSFYLNWDAYYNNEPHYASYRAMDINGELLRSGFRKDRLFQMRIPNFGTVPDKTFAAVARGEQPAPAHGNGASWFIFGAWK